MIPTRRRWRRVGTENYIKRGSIPETYRNQGHFWFTAQLLSHILQPNAKTMVMISELKRQLNWLETMERPLMSLHVRRGDSCLDAHLKKRTCDSLQDYMDSAVLPMTRM
jgi:hypothetical protein